MPIRSIEHDYEFGSGLPCIARIRKGGKKTDPKRPGPDLSYFRVTMEPGFERYLSTFQLLYGEQPQAFSPVRFGGAALEDVFDYWMKEHTATKLTRKCDGETQVRHFDAATGEYNQEPIACAAPTCGCKQVGRIKLFLPQLINEIGVFGYVWLTTTSLYDIRNILSCFKDLERIVGDLSSVDFLIGRASRIISAPVPEPRDKAKYKREHDGRDWRPGDRMNITKNLIYIRPNEQYTKTVLLGMVSSKPPPLEDGAQHGTALRQLVNGTPRPQRRISGPKQGTPEPPPMVEADDDEDDGEQTPEWLNDGLKWVRDQQFELSNAQINDALLYADGWMTSKDIFKAAIIAASCNYDLGLIEQLTSSRYTIELFDLAKGISEARNAASEGVVVP